MILFVETRALCIQRSLKHTFIYLWLYLKQTSPENQLCLKIYQTFWIFLASRNISINITPPRVSLHDTVEYTTSLDLTETPDNYLYLSLSGTSIKNEASTNSTE